jgi:hypothetical protein
MGCPPSEYPSDSNSPNTLSKVSPDAFAPLDQNGEKFEADCGQLELRSFEADIDFVLSD